jgi:hypothetical protein
LLTIWHQRLNQFIYFFRFLTLTPPLTEYNVTANTTHTTNTLPPATAAAAYLARGRLRLPASMLLHHLLLPTWRRLRLLLLLLLLLKLLLCGVFASHHADLFCVLQVVTVAFEQAAVDCHLHPHNLINTPTAAATRTTTAAATYTTTACQVICT